MTATRPGFAPAASTGDTTMNTEYRNARGDITTDKDVADDWHLADQIVDYREDGAAWRPWNHSGPAYGRIKVMHPLVDLYGPDHPADTGDARAHLSDPYVAMRAAIVAALPDGWTVAREPIPHNGGSTLPEMQIATVHTPGRAQQCFRVARPGFTITQAAAAGSSLVRTA